MNKKYKQRKEENKGGGGAVVLKTYFVVNVPLPPIFGTDDKAWPRKLLCLQKPSFQKVRFRGITHPCRPSRPCAKQE